MIEKKISNFSINQICDSGQCFRMTKLDDGSVEVIAKGGYLTNKESRSDLCDGRGK